MVVINLVLKNHEPQINADERRLNALSLDIIKVEFEKGRECILKRVMGKYNNHFGINRKLLAIINDKSRATNLRLSAFICGLNNSQKTKQPDFILILENRKFFFVNHISEIHFRLDLR